MNAANQPTPRCDTYLRKQDSAALYGAAVLMMVFHHCFLDPHRLHCDYVSVFGQFQLIETRLAWAGKMCVAIFAFLSGYAFHVICSEKTGKYGRFLLSWSVMLRQGRKFYGKVLLTACIFIPIGVLFYQRTFSVQRVIRAVLFGEYYNGEWWYIRQYLFFLLIFPFVLQGLRLADRLFQKHRPLFVLLLIFGLCGLAAVIVDSPFSRRLHNWLSDHGAKKVLNDYAILFLCGVLICRYRLFDRLHSCLSRQIRLASPYWYLLGILLLFCVRAVAAKSASDSRTDVILCPLFIFLTAGIGHRTEGHFPRALLSFFGRYSTFIWLTHTFFLYYYWQSLALLPKYSILIYIWTVSVSLVFSISLDAVLRGIRHAAASFKALIIRKKEHLS